MLLLCRLRGWPTEGYRLASHPCQQALLKEVAAAAEVDSDSLQKVRETKKSVKAAKKEMSG